MVSKTLLALRYPPLLSMKNDVWSWSERHPEEMKDDAYCRRVLWNHVSTTQRIIHTMKEIIAENEVIELDYHNQDFNDCILALSRKLESLEVICREAKTMPREAPVD